MISTATNIFADDIVRIARCDKEAIVTIITLSNKVIGDTTGLASKFSIRQLKVIALYLSFRCRKNICSNALKCKSSILSCTISCLKQLMIPSKASLSKTHNRFDGSGSIETSTPGKQFSLVSNDDDDNDDQTESKLRLYHNFRGTFPEVPSAEIVNAIKASKHNLSIDDLLVMILSTRDQELDNLKQQEENCQYDLAILASEEQRDIFQEHKRRQICNILKDCSVRIYMTGEFANSIILNPILPAFWYQADEILPESYLLVRKLVDFLDCPRISCLEVADNIIDRLCTCDKLMMELRKVLIRLLILERDALKYFRLASHSYIKLMMEFMGNILTTRGSHSGKNCHFFQSNKLAY